MTVAGRLAELAAEYGLDGAAVDALGRLLAHQAADEHASTTVRDAAAAVDRHVADSLSALALPSVRAARRIADLGSGAGWPGLALAAALPGTQVALVESASRRCRYLARAVEAAGLTNAEVVHARAEDWPEGVGRHDLVTARALAALPVLCEYAAPLLVTRGELVAYKGAVDDDEARTGARAAAELGLEPTGVLAVTPYPAARAATLHRFRKIAPTPARFPRRPGMALKRPLGA
ncbi:MAG: rRNA (guanine527-N7)-methyltransferase [Solirubrobacteraceae bacterium]|nr:rRNA (guanine527-N7)-methyltransferase [Solirubrobacteraceae bacterium]